MELKRYFKILYKRLWIMILLPMVFGGITAYVSFYVLTEIYESDTTLYVANKNEDGHISIVQGDLAVGQMLVEDYSELIRSRTVTDAVIKKMGLKDITPEELAEQIEVIALSGTRIIQIAAQSDDPKVAKDIANNIADVFISKATELMKVDNISIVDKAEISTKPIKPDPVKNIAISVFLSVVVAFGITLLVEYMDSSIKDKKEVEELGFVVLGVIPVINLK